MSHAPPHSRPPQPVANLRRSECANCGDAIELYTCPECGLMHMALTVAGERTVYAQLVSGKWQAPDGQVLDDMPMLPPCRDGAGT